MNSRIYHINETTMDNSLFARTHQCLALLFKSLMLFIAFSSMAHAATMVATVSKNRVTKNEVFQLRISIDQKVSSEDLDLSVLEEQFFMSRPSFGTSVNIINGDRSNRSEWNVSLAALELGTLTIPSFSLNGAQTKPIRIQVELDAMAPDENDLIELQHKLDRYSLYPDESAYLTTRLVIKADPRRLQNPQVIPPKVDGMSIALQGEPKQYQSVLDGIEVTIVDQTYRITAEKPGSFTLQTTAFKGGVIYGNNRTGSTSLIQIDNPGEQLPVTVKQPPADYVGRWLPTSTLVLNQQWTDGQGQSIDSNTVHELAVGDAITRQITLDVVGLTAEQLPNVVINNPQGVRVYNEKPSFETLSNEQGSDNVTRMTIKQVLIPQRAGEFQLEPVSINWWNSLLDKADNSQVEGLDLTVNAAASIDEDFPAPVAAMPQQVIIKKDAGYWPYVSGIFALLWLATLGYAVKVRNQGDTVKPTAAAQKPEDNSFLNAIESNDAIAASQRFKGWSKALNINDEDHSTIKAKLQSWQASLYGSDTSDQAAARQALLSAIKQIQKSQRTDKSSQQPLARL